MLVWNYVMERFIERSIGEFVQVYTITMQNAKYLESAHFTNIWEIRIFLFLRLDFALDGCVSTI